ncbi:hypothetical protein [Kocuria sp. ZOR0020]|uniref:hypothetical protein n=1 Tax=Kocuria sp. ZOR0020 TaxID=1339234 RepID=UPI0012E0823E|nr:hypothetical protein [Kocuria sp. ZOR0020]
MPTPQHVPPPELRDRCFSLRDATRTGLTGHQLFGPGYESVMTGVWRSVHHSVHQDPVARLLDVLPPLLSSLPTTAANHLTSALLLGLRLPGWLRKSTPIHLTRWVAGRAPRFAGVTGHVAQLDPQDRWSSGDVRVVGPPRTVVDLAGMKDPHSGTNLITDDALVAVLDGLISFHQTGIHAGKPPPRALAEVEADLVRMGRRRGVARVRRNLSRCAAGVDSALETHARLALEHAGLAGFVTDREIRVPGMGSANPGLAHEQWKIAIQVEGPHHDQQGQRTRDIKRQRITEAAGWIEIRVTAADLVPPYPGGEPRIVNLVREAMKQRVASSRR